jgi:integrase
MTRPASRIGAASTRRTAASRSTNHGPGYTGCKSRRFKLSRRVVTRRFSRREGIRRRRQAAAVYQVKWDSTYMDVPIVDEQNTPSFTTAEIETIISKAEGQDSVLYSLLGGSGLRIGEAFALRVEDVRGTVLHVKASA